MYRLRLIISKEDLDLVVDRTDKTVKEKLTDAEDSEIPVMIFNDDVIEHLIDAGYIREWL